MYDGHDDDRCVPYSRPKKRDVLAELIDALNEDVTTYANLQIDAEEQGDTEQAAEHKKKFKEAQTCLALVTERSWALHQYNRGERHIGEPYTDAALDSWLYPTVESYYWETHEKVKRHGVEAASATTREQKQMYLGHRRGQFMLRAYIRSHYAHVFDTKWGAEPRDEYAEMLPDRHEYA